jgi:hypothetical protein
MELSSSCSDLMATNLRIPENNAGMALLNYLNPTNKKTGARAVSATPR